MSKATSICLRRHAWIKYTKEVTLLVPKVLSIQHRLEYYDMSISVIEIEVESLMDMV